MARAQLFVLGTDLLKVMVWKSLKINEARVEGAEDLSRINSSPAGGRLTEFHSSLKPHEVLKNLDSEKFYKLVNSAEATRSQSPRSQYSSLGVLINLHVLLKKYNN